MPAGHELRFTILVPFPLNSLAQQSRCFRELRSLTGRLLLQSGYVGTRHVAGNKDVEVALLLRRYRYLRCFLKESSELPRIDIHGDIVTLMYG